MTAPTLREQVKSLPTTPGVYQYFDETGGVIYVGKAKNLRSRVNSYFAGKLDPRSKTAALVSNISNIKYIEVLSEIEALILEAELIKKYRPKYNIALKDDKSYLYIVIRDELLEKAGNKVKIPRILTARKPDLKPKDDYFGPFPDSYTTKYIVRSLRKMIPFRDCAPSKFSRYEKMNRPCLYGHLGLCTAPCLLSSSLEDYKSYVKKVRRFLKGEGSKIVVSFYKEMEKASKSQQYEKAKELRDIIRKFEYVRQSFKTANKYIENPYLVEDLIAKSLDDLVENISILKTVPTRIECYDIANISGKEAVGSLVVATEGRIDKSQYRKFRIKFKDTPDDFEMMREVLRRRARNKWPLPDLFVLDGGKGQVSAGLKVMEELSLEIPLVGLAKRYETIVYKEGDSFVEINLSKDSEGLKLLQRLRDEAHRFAQKYHHQLRLKKISDNQL